MAHSKQKPHKTPEQVKYAAESKAKRKAAGKKLDISEIHKRWPEERMIGKAPMGSPRHKRLVAKAQKEDRADSKAEVAATDAKVRKYLDGKAKKKAPAKKDAPNSAAGRVKSSMRKIRERAKAAKLQEKAAKLKSERKAVIDKLKKSGKVKS